MQLSECYELKQVLREMKILRHLNHCVILSLLDVFSFDLDSLSESKSVESLYMVFDFFDTDLLKVIKSNQYLTRDHIQFILFQLFDGISYLHDKNVLHRDLKPSNILINCSNCAIKIADFGLSCVIPRVPSEFDSNTAAGEFVFREHERYVQDSSNSRTDATFSLPKPPRLQRKMTMHVVTRWYRAPEILFLQSYAEPIDVWSLGCIMVDLLAMLKENGIDYKRRRALFPGER
jgi:mitogen-activated protein kinase 1/3